MIPPVGVHKPLALHWSLVFMLFLCGCAGVGPDYTPPEVPVSPAWHAATPDTPAPGPADPERLSRWWETLHDPILTGLVKTAVERNPDLRQALSRVKEARARRSIAGADLLPTLDASGAVSRSRGSRNLGSTETRTKYTAGLDAAWELDLFGGVRRSVEAADADLQATREDLSAVQVSLCAEVALAYIEVRTYQARLAVAHANLKNQEEICQITGERLKAGLTDELDVQQARANLMSSRARIPSLGTGLEGSMNRLAVLLGMQPGELHSELEDRRPIPAAPLSVAVGVPADVLRQRPDIRRAERELAAQTARVGVAEAELFPKLSLGGSIGLEALNSGELFTSDAGAWSFGPRLSWPVFRAGAIRKNVAVQSARQEQALLAYEAAVLGALEEVENALVSFAAERRRKESLEQAADAAHQAYDLARVKYESGLTDFTHLLDAQRSLLALEDELSSSDGTLAANLVRLYKSLGGGWVPSTGTQEKKS
jgi:NodT family efflux transporter outer membrane factor (OMF) lipoprotein